MAFNLARGGGKERCAQSNQPSRLSVFPTGASHPTPPSRLSEDTVVTATEAESRGESDPLCGSRPSGSHRRAVSTPPRAPARSPNPQERYVTFHTQKRSASVDIESSVRYLQEAKAEALELGGKGLFLEILILYLVTN